jgi:hypothetical protein
MPSNLLRYAIFSVFLIFAACQIDPDQEEWVSMAEHQDVLRAQEELGYKFDSLREVLSELQTADSSKFEIKPPNEDSILKVYQNKFNLKVNVPSLYTEASVAPRLLKQFRDLATTTQGQLKLLAASDEIQSVISDIIEEHGQDELDLLIVLDRTNSMKDDIDDVRSGIKDILDGLKKYPNSRLALATYADKHQDTLGWYNYLEFGTKHEGITPYLDSLKHSNGGDTRESVYDGLHRAMEEGFFKSRSKRMIILIGDAASHEDEKTTYTLRDIVRLSRRDKVRMNFYPIIIHPGLRKLQGAGESKYSDQTPIIESIYPNPSTGLSNLRFYEAKELEVSIYNQSGTLVRSYKSETLELRVDLSDQSPGVYVIRAVYQGKQFDQRKLILKP